MRNRPEKPNTPAARVGDDAYIVPLSGCPARPVKTENAPGTEKRTAR